MKSLFSLLSLLSLLSLSLRERGLKSHLVQGLSSLSIVALFTGAWIEIIKSILHPPPTIVALFTGAWIEINSYQDFLQWFCVALFTGAWIEIKFRNMRFENIRGSLSLRERGLKSICHT